MNPLTEEKKTDINSTLNQVKARASQLQGVQPSISANDLTQPRQPVQVPEPAVATLPQQSSRLVSNITRDVNGFISAQTEEAKQLKDLQATYGAMNDQGSLSSLYNSTLEDAGVTGDSFKELKDISLQLSDMDTSSELTKTRIRSGNSMEQANREVSQEDRENAVRSAGLAARAAVLQGNIQTATAAAQQAVNIAFQDRQLTATNLLNQIEMVQGQVDEQTGQLLEQEKRNYQAELAKIEEVKGAVSNAIVSGGASQAEIAQMTNPATTDEQKLALAQSIMGRTAGADRALAVQAQQASIANIYDQINSRKIALREATLEAATEKEKLEAEKIEKSDTLLETQKMLSDVASMAGLSSAVGFGVKKTLLDKIPFVSGDAIEGTARADFEIVATRLSDMFLVQNLDKMTGVLTDRDLEVLRNEGTTIGNFNQSEESWFEEKARLDAMIQRGILENGITEEQAEFWGVLEPSDIQTFNSLWETL